MYAIGVRISGGSSRGANIFKTYILYRELVIRLHDVSEAAGRQLCADPLAASYLAASAQTARLERVPKAACDEVGELLSQRPDLLPAMVSRCRPRGSPRPRRTRGAWCT